MELLDKISSWFRAVPKSIEDCYNNHKDFHIDVYRDGFYCTKCDNHVTFLEVAYLDSKKHRENEYVCYSSHKILKVDRELKCFTCNRSLNILEYAKWKKKQMLKEHK